LPHPTKGSSKATAKNFNKVRRLTNINIDQLAIDTFGMS
jgi:hypothetical protein